MQMARAAGQRRPSQPSAARLEVVLGQKEQQGSGGGRGSWRARETRPRRPQRWAARRLLAKQGCSCVWWEEADRR